MDDGLDTNKKYVIGVSGGPDSMTLLSLCVKHQISVVVAHVNYQKRKSAWRDEEIVRSFCSEHGLIMEVLYPEYRCGNFQAWARDVRYSFYKTLCIKYDCCGVLLAHQQDDVLETFLMQKERGSKVDYFGMKSVRDYQGMMVYRPLLGWTRREIMQYVHDACIPYGIDETNLEDHYRRNRIRHEVIEVASDEQRLCWLREMDEENRELLKYTSMLDSLMKDEWPVDQYKQESEKVRVDGLRRYLKKHNIHEADFFRDKYLLEVDAMICSGKNCQVPLNNEYVLDVSYGVMSIRAVAKAYSVMVHEIGIFKHPYFEIGMCGPSTCAVFVEESDFPLTIRNYRDGDKILLRFGHKKVSRWFMDRKIPLWQRNIWPIVENRNHEIILVPQIGCNVEHYNAKANLFVIK